MTDLVHFTFKHLSKLQSSHAGSLHKCLPLDSIKQDRKLLKVLSTVAKGPPFFVLLLLLTLCRSVAL
jgi:hypothetical protein